MKYQINQNQCGFLLKDGRFIKTLSCGTYHFIKNFGYEVLMEDMDGSLIKSQKKFYWNRIKHFRKKYFIS